VAANLRTSAVRTHRQRTRRGKGPHGSPERFRGEEEQAPDIDDGVSCSDAGAGILSGPQTALRRERSAGSTRASGSELVSTMTVVTKGEIPAVLVDVWLPIIGDRTGATGRNVALVGDLV
jgi:hypothetical protein